MKKIVVVFLLLCSVLLANSEYNIFVSAFGDDVTQESIERERADIERKVAKIDGVKAVVSGRFGRYRSIAVKTRTMNKNDIKVLTQKIKAAGFKEAYALVAKEDETQTGIVEQKTGEEKPPTKPRSKLRKDLKFIKKSRIRNDRRSIRQILKFDPNRENLPQTIRINNGAWQIV